MTPQGHRRRCRQCAFGVAARLIAMAAAAALAFASIAAASSSLPSRGGRAAPAFVFVPVRHGGITKTSSWTKVPPSSPPPSAATSLRMIGGMNIGREGKSVPEPSLPRDVKDAVSRCRSAVQEALGKKMSRMDVEFPVGTKFGVEKESGRGGGKKRGGRMAGALDDDAGDGSGRGPTRDQLDTSDRELARLFVEMFQPVGGENIAVVFNDEGSADAARKRWRTDPSAVCRVLAVDRKGKKKGGSGMGGMGKKSGGRKKRPAGFAAKMAAELEGDGASGPFALPDGTEVALFVAPGPKELVAVERVCGEVGMGTLVILLNARLGRVANFGTDQARELFRDDFEAVFHLAAAPQDEAPGCLLHRAYPGDWVLARKPKVGPPKTIAVRPGRPTPEECAEAYRKVEIGELEQGVENVLENLAGWFK